ncbi:MAG: hypothetical protein ACK4FV_06680 [Candidatus Nitrosocaldus sp.]
MKGIEKDSRSIKGIEKQLRGIAKQITRLEKRLNEHLLYQLLLQLQHCDNLALRI